MNSLKTSLWRTSLFASVAAGVSAFSMANAQTPPAPAEGTAAPAAEQAKDTVVVVGSRIRRDEFSSPSPVQVITKEESTLAGLSSTADILQSNGATGGSSQINNAYGGYVTDGGPGANTLSLRGLGASRTLVLLNGRRIAPAGTRGAVGSADLNVLPNAMVERIEILKDGASSVYGSDAVAGVVNIVTERGTDGWSTEAQYNTTEAGGGEALRAALVGGYTADTWEISGSLEYYDRSPLQLKDRDWAACQIGGLRDPDTGASLDYIDPATGKPKCYPTGATGMNGVTINTIGTATAAGVAAPGSTGTTFNRWRPNSSAGGAFPGFEGIGGGATLDVRDTFDPRMLNQDIISPGTTYTAYLQGSFDLAALGNAEAYFEVLGTERQSSQTGYRQLSLDYPTGSPLLSAVYNGRGANQAQAGHPTVNGVRAFIGFGNYQTEQEVDFWRGVVGLRGSITSDWNYDISAMYSYTDASYTFESFLWDRMTASLNGCSAFPGQPVGFDFTGCVVAPALTTAVIGGQLPTPWRNYMFRPVTGNNTFDETTYSAVVDGPLFQLPAGPIQAVFGVEYRDASIDDQPPADSINNNTYNLTSAVVTKGSDSVTEAFTELEIPLLKNQPFAHELTANLSGRYTDYESYGSDETYKIGALYSPVDWFSLRATYGTSFRAPALFEQFLGATTGFASAAGDPCANYGALLTTSTRYINCNAELNNTAFTQPLSSTTVISSGGAGTGALAAETSKALTYGFVLQPSLPAAWGDFSLAVDYYRIEVKDEVSKIGSAAILQLCYDDPQFRAGGGFCNLVQARDPVSFALTVNDSYTNVASQNVEGIDYNLRYVRDLGVGTFRVNALLTQYLEQSEKLFDSDPLDQNNGNLQSPEYSGQLDFTYDYKAWKFRYGLGWLSAMDSNEFLGVDPSVDPYDFSTDDYFLSNASIQYTSPDDWDFTVGIRNIADEAPPSVPAYAYNRVGNALLYSGFDYLGRSFFINIGKNF